MNHNGIDDRKQSFCSLWDDKDLNKKNKDSNTKHAILRKQMGPDILNYVVNPKPSTIYYIPNEFWSFGGLDKLPPGGKTAPAFWGFF